MTRKYYGLGFLIIAGLLGTSLYLQYFGGFQPCPLCMLQRFAFIGVGLFLLLGFLFYKIGFLRILSTLLALLSASAGLALAGRQIWLQHNPAAAGSECGVSLQYMLEALPLNEVAQRVFQGSAECTTRGWDFLSLSMAEWSFIFFVVFFVWSAFLIKKR